MSLFNIIEQITKNPVNPEQVSLSLDDAAELLKITPEALKEFEQEYHKADFAKGISDNYFEVNAKQAASLRNDNLISNETTRGLIERIVKELVAQTVVYSYENKKQYLIDYTHRLEDKDVVKVEDVNTLPIHIRPQCTGNAYMRDFPDSGKTLLDELERYLKETDARKKKILYGVFRQGLDILDLDGLTYAMIDTNKTSMGYWLPRITKAVDDKGFFKIPATKIIKVPISVLQLTRQFDYQAINRTTLDIVDNFVHEVFELDDNKTYFIKTGIASSKYDFRNAKVQGEKEVKELGEYLLFIHQQHCQMASPLSSPVIYGAGTTVEWVAREFIEDVEDNMTIYHGLPLHTEYRVFVDFDSNEVLGIHNYWDPALMLEHFREKAKRDYDIDAKHDYVTYKANMDRLVNRYEDNKNIVVNHVKEFLADVEMNGQWSVDIMQNGNDFYLIDMAPAETSSFYKETVLEDKRKPMIENWLPHIPSDNV